VNAGQWADWLLIPDAIAAGAGVLLGRTAKSVFGNDRSRRLAEIEAEIEADEPMNELPLSPRAESSSTASPQS
jgi:hypothetical protein